MKISENGKKAAPAPQIFEFGDFRMDVGERLLWQRDGSPVPLTPTVFATLRYLVEHSDTVLDKERIMEAVWPDSIVEENNLAQSISKLRQVFGEKPGAHRYIATVPTRGYRFVAEVKVAQASTLQAGSEQAASMRYPEAMEPARPRAGGEAASLARPARGRAGSIAAVLAILLLGGAAFFWWRGSAHPPAGSPAPLALSEKSIAVLPFENLSDDKQNAYFTDGVQDEILTRLAKLADLKVISRVSVMQYRDKAMRNLPEIAQQLGVAHLLEGSVQRVGNRVRINAQLISTRTGSHVWAETYDRDLADVFAIQSELAAAIAQQLQAKISPREKAALGQTPTTDLAANALYQQALEIESKETEPESLLGAVRLLEEAVVRDPRFVAAYCTASRMHLMLYFGGIDHTEARREEAKVAIEKAARVQPDDGEVHLAWARYWLFGFREYDRARAELHLAQRTLPNHPKVYFLSATIDRRQGRWNEAIRNFERAVELEPRDTESLMNASYMYEGLQRYADATRMAERALAVSPRDYIIRLHRASQPLNERADARPLRAELDAILAQEPDAGPKIAGMLFLCAVFERDPAATDRALAAIPPQGIAVLNFVRPREWYVGYAARLFHDPEKARTAFFAARAKVENTVREQPDNAIAWSMLGRIDSALGQKDEAVQAGRRACELLPLSKDAWWGLDSIRNLVWIHGWLGDKDRALEQLEFLQDQPRLYYGWLKLDPNWDSLRGDPRFEKIVAALAP